MERSADSVSVIRLQNDHPMAQILLGKANGNEASVDEWIPEALHTIRLHLAMDVAFVSEITHGERTFRYVDAAEKQDAVKAGSGGPADGSYCQRVIDGRLPELIRDAWTLNAALEVPATKTLPVRAHLSVPIRLSDGRVYGTFCCYSARPDLTLDERDLAMMHAFADFTGRMIERRLEAQRLHREKSSRIRSVLDGRAFRVVYQPIVRIPERQVLGFESLTRFTAQPARNPDLWFEEASEVGLGEQLECTVIEQAMAALDHLPESVYLSLNISPANILSGALEQVISKAPLKRLVVEVTEHDVIQDYEALGAVLAPLRQQGLRVAVDDAGAGYASFRHVIRLDPDLIKLDVDLIRNIDRDRKRRALAAALISFARETGSMVIAEGVETQSELDTLTELNVNRVQGYLLGRPVELALASSMI